MNAIDIIKIACDFTGNENISAKLDANETLSQNDQKVVNKMIKCLNLIQNEVACQYVPLVNVENLTATDFKIQYSSFAKKPISIIWVKDKFGRNIRFKAFADYLMIFGNNAKIKYYYMPEEITSSSQEITEALLPMRIYAYGVAREFLLMQSLNDEADIWEVRFKDSLAIFARKKQDVKMPCRRWL